MTKNFFKAAVIGDPISHSLSPKLHNYWLKKYNINGSYEAIHVKPQELETAIKSIVEDGYKGFNVTIPHKEKVFQLIKSQDSSLISQPLSPSALQTGAVNTVIIKQNGALYGHNSDCEGFFNNLKHSLKKSSSNDDFADKNAFVIGAGGAARAIIHSLIVDAKVKNIFITNRSKDKFITICQDLQAFLKKFDTNLQFLDSQNFAQNLSNCDLLVNSSSLGMLNQPPLKIDLKNLKKSAIVYDIVYKPLLTDLLKNAQNQGNKIVTGIGMLAFQGAVGFEFWFAQKPEIDENLLKLLIEE